jgi:hypothetical protein
MAVAVVDVERRGKTRARGALRERVRAHEFEGKDQDEEGSRLDVKWGGRRETAPAVAIDKDSIILAPLVSLSKFRRASLGESTCGLSS